MKTIKCAICGEKERIGELYPERLNRSKISGKTYSARRVPDGMHHRFVRCDKCDLIFSNPILEPKEIERLYKRSECSYGWEIENIKETYWQLFEKLQITNYKLKILDIGCGNGFFLEALMEHGFENVWGVEPGKDTRRKTKDLIQKRIKWDVLRRGLFKPGSFDVVTCFQTLDHIVDVNEFLQITRKLLKKGGHILFVVHDTEGLSVKLLGEGSPIFDIEHIFLFNRRNLERIFKRNGFEQISTFSVLNRYSLGYWIEKGLGFRVQGIVEKLIIGRLPVTLGAGNIGIITKKGARIEIQ